MIPQLHVGHILPVVPPGAHQRATSFLSARTSFPLGSVEFRRSNRGRYQRQKAKQRVLKYVFRLCSQ
jgi:hypothetical protein